MDIVELLLNNFTTVCLVIGFGTIALANRSLGERTNRYFIFFDLLVLVLIAADMVESYFSIFHEPSVYRHLASAIGYTLRPASIALLIGILLRRKRSGIALWIAVAAVGLLAFTSDLTHLMFWYDAQNMFMRGPLGYISHILSGILVVILIGLTMKLHLTISFGEMFAVIYSAFICVVATVLESVLSGYKSLLTGAMMTSCALYYIVLYIETYRRDPLTGLMNRRSVYLDAKRLRNKSIAIISIDLNELKQINDTLGHNAGDKALQKVGGAMLKAGARAFLSYRVGGDEFMALGKEQSAEAAQAYIDSVRTSLRQEKLTAAFGCVFYAPGDNFDSICNEADARMYDDKRQYKHRARLRGENDAPAVSPAK